MAAVPLFANAGTPSALSEKHQVELAATCLGLANADTASLVSSRFSTAKEDVTMTWGLTTDANIATISPAGICTLSAPQSRLLFRPIGVAYIPNPPEGGAVLLEMKVGKDGSRVFTNGR